MQKSSTFLIFDSAIFTLDLVLSTWYYFSIIYAINTYFSNSLIYLSLRKISAAEPRLHYAYSMIDSSELSVQISMALNHTNVFFFSLDKIKNI